MTDSRFKIVFSGELMPDAALDTVKDNLARLFKSDRDKIDALFTGNPVALKRDLSDSEADKYIGALQNAGAKVYKEPDLSASLSLVETDDHRTTPVEETARMTCPKCGHEQTKSIECSACGIVIEKYLTRQAQLAEAAAAIPPAAPVAVAAAEAAPAPVSLTPPLAAADAAGGGASPYATPRARVDDGDEVGELSYFGVDGRIGRVRYLGWYLGMVFVTSLLSGVFAAAAAISGILSVVLSLVMMVVTVVLTVFIGAKRLHDLGWSAWLLFLILIPVINLIFLLVLLFMPGTKGPNRYGPPPPPNSKGVIVLACIVPFVFIATIAAVAIPAYQQYVERASYSSESEVEVPVDEVAPAEPGEAAEAVPSQE